jgi:hypothetical protein
MRGRNLGRVLVLAAALSRVQAAGADTRVSPISTPSRQPSGPGGRRSSATGCRARASTRVYAVGGLDYDLFRYGQYWYINDAATGIAPATTAAIRPDPLRHGAAQIVVVPERYHRHPMHPLGGPPGQMKRYENATSRA